jgi:hypothetical protein
MDSPHQAINNMVISEPLQHQAGSSEPMAFPHVNYMANSVAANPMNHSLQTGNNMAGTEQHQGAGEPTFYFYSPSTSKKKIKKSSLCTASVFNVDVEVVTPDHIDSSFLFEKNRLLSNVHKVPKD